MLNKNKQIPALLRSKTPQAPGLCKLYFIAVENLSADPSVFSSPGIIAALPTLWAKFATAELPNFNRDYSEEQREDDGGDFLEITINGFLPFENSTQHSYLRNMQHHRYVLMVVNPLGLVKWIGTKENPVKMLQSYSSSKRGGSSSGTNIRFVWRSKEKPPVLGIPIPTSALL